ncbi:MAG: LLM class flavin-dependent oxidoreductase [Acidimicrobiia bacterium]
MNNHMTGGVGLVLGGAVPPEKLAKLATGAESAGFDELWISEDFFVTGGISAANTVLSSTNSIRVGLGVVSALVRHPALLAMEIATTSRAHPGRFTPGVGLGVPVWMEQMNLLPKSPLSAMRGCVTAVRDLLDGKGIASEGKASSYDPIRLEFPPTERVPLYMGAVGQKMLELSGEIADGSILSVGAGSEYVKWARKQVEIGRQRSGRTGTHRITVFAIYSVGPDAQEASNAARKALAFYKGTGGRNALTDVAGISDELEGLAARGGIKEVEEAMPDRWIDDLTISGTPDEVVAKITRLRESGADAIGLFPADGDRIEEVLNLTASHVLPEL